MVFPVLRMVLAVCALRAAVSAQFNMPDVMEWCAAARAVPVRISAARVARRGPIVFPATFMVPVDKGACFLSTLSLYPKPARDKHR
jgi:hypothetical protein